MPAIGAMEVLLAAAGAVVSAAFGIALVVVDIWARTRAGRPRYCVDCRLPLAPGAVECPHCGRPGPLGVSPRYTVDRFAKLLRPAHLIGAVPLLLAAATVITPADPLSFIAATSVLLALYGILVAGLEWFAFRSRRSRAIPLRPCLACGQPLSIEAVRCPRCGTG